jgi:hypothetical protein
VLIATSLLCLVILLCLAALSRCTGRVTVIPEVTPKSSYFPIGHNPTGARKTDVMNSTSALRCA